nr:uncharacterized protein LOC110374491 [Helicoverpa armigera]
MFHSKIISKFKYLIVLISLERVTCSIEGSLPKPRLNDTRTGDDPCNPLYWYPKNIPEYCNFRKLPTPPTVPRPEIPIPVPIPVPIPPHLPIPMPIIPPPVIPPIMMPPDITPPGPPPPIMLPHPVMPLPMPLPFGIPLAPTNPMVPVAGIPLPPPPVYPMAYPPPYPAPYPSPYGSPYPHPMSPPLPYPPSISHHLPYHSPIAPPFPSPLPGPFPGPLPGPFPGLPPHFSSPFPVPPRRGIGLVPGIPGLVSPDGGINIMPFSDAYSDMLEKHKQKMIRRRLQKMLSEYDRPPWKAHKKTRRSNGEEDVYIYKPNENVID